MDEARRRGRVAGDDEQLDAQADELGRGLKGIADDGFGAFGPVGHAGRVSKEEVVLFGHEPPHGVEHGEAAYAGIKEGDGERGGGVVRARGGRFGSHVFSLWGGASLVSEAGKRPCPGSGVPPKKGGFADGLLPYGCLRGTSEGQAFREWSRSLVTGKRFYSWRSCRGSRCRSSGVRHPANTGRVLSP